MRVVIKERRLTKELRVLGLDHEAAAKKIGVTPSAISQWVNGKTLPTPINTMKLREIGVTKEARMNPSELV